MFRYWLPDASADIVWIENDLKEIVAVGAGGFEWLPHYQLGGGTVVDWSEYGNGTDAYLQCNRAALRAALQNGLLMDFDERTLTWSLLAASANSTWRIVAWYHRYTNQRSISGGTEPTNFIQNGSWIVDHFSAKGSNRMTDFYDQYIIPRQDDKDLLAKVGHYGKYIYVFVYTTTK
jgi:hypothetical protein